ncbi:MAG: hypothetical protein KAI84_04045, partial [Gammaproteobacteria bacterium]|nr:hypothetical protein [Gammaproteobacteria bacterium]
LQDKQDVANHPYPVNPVHPVQFIHAFFYNISLCSIFTNLYAKSIDMIKKPAQPNIHRNV